MWKYNREEEFLKIVNKEREKILRSLYIIDMNNRVSDEKLINNQKELIDEARTNNDLVNFVLDKHTMDSLEIKKKGVHNIVGSYESDLIKEYKSEISKPNTHVYYKNSRNGMYNRTLQDDITYYKNLREIIVMGIDIYDFAIGLSNYLDEINKDVKILISRSTTNLKENFYYLNSLLDDRGICVVENNEYLKQLEKLYKLRK